MSYQQYPQQQAYQAAAGEPPLWAPYYGAPFPVAVRRFFKKYATFSGRASRSEYWWWVLVAAVVGIIINIITAVGGSAGATVAANGTAVPGPGATVGLVVAIIWGLATIVPSLALTVRRLHDVNVSGWLVLLGLVPFLGAIALLVLTILPSKPEGQRFDVPAA
ncbi:DUF805 domain-containing protein [Arthrobacter globiformis]|jgi:uncharacterized membrane protein YhaH (DUF805 family)|uniref:DUF805 domain-containing protein n=2 Tax=Arthrobacter TaxID=1663 RepID=H0QLI2_ARTG1|nr:DUF805 domain-containing protein [Arthrobacter globiformis]GAB13683.1 hypothetical protein ARGLB_047_00330 [Arthrobacter globiformis NBRC 12137]